MAYIPYNPNPNGWNTGDCVIRALSVATGYDWERIYIELCIQGFMMGQLPSTNSVWGAYLRGRNFSRYVIPNSCPDCYTVRDFCYDHPRGLYLLCTGGNDGTHILACVDGDYIDSWDSGNEIPIYYWRKN